MIIRDLIEGIGRKAPYEFEGRDDVPIRGLGLKARRRGVGRTLFVLAGRDWHPSYPRIYRKDGISDEEEIQAALDNGAAGLVLPSSFRGHPLTEGRNVFFVEDTLEFAFRAAEAFRGMLSTKRLTAVTGSAGKTTTKRMIQHALGAGDPSKSLQRVSTNRNLATEAAWQLSWAPRFDHTVLEVDGGSFRQAVEHNFSIAPDVAVITSIAEAHLDHHGDLQGVARNKSQIINGVGPGGALVLNRDTEMVDWLLGRAHEEGVRTITYGESPDAAVRLVDYELTTGKVTADVVGERFSYMVGARGRHMALNSLAVIAALRVLEVEDWRAGARALESFEPISGRGATADVVLSTGERIRLVDESYNANPASMKAALSTFAEMPVESGGRRIALLGDIRALGEASESVHRRLADVEGLQRVDELHLIGECMVALHDELQDGDVPVTHWSSVQEMGPGVLSELRTGDVVLAKASQATGLNRLINRISREFPGQD